MSDQHSQAGETNHRKELLLASAAYRESDFPTLRLVRESRAAKRFAAALIIALLGATCLLLFVPWQQNITGKGTVVARDPTNRPQSIPAPVKGRIRKWGDGIHENALVRKGQIVVEIEDLDSELLSRLEAKLAAGEEQRKSLSELVLAKLRELDFGRTVAESYTAKVAASRQFKQQTLEAIDQYILMTEEKLGAERQKLEAAIAVLQQAEPDAQRQRELYDLGLTSQYKMQLAVSKFESSQAKVSEARQNLAAAERELEGKRIERGSKERKIQADIDSDQAVQQKATGDIAKMESEISKARADLSKLEGEILDYQKELARQQNQVIRAPRDGRIVRLIENQTGTYVSQGKPLFELPPETVEPAVELFVDGNDVPLISPGRNVRLQFEGWPAIQFSGWPVASYGTFGGRVLLVDATDDGKGKFRILVEPDPGDGQWPQQNLLRQGSRANGWVLLDTVPLGYELWRRMNGFPANYIGEEADSKEKPAKPPLIKP